VCVCVCGDVGGERGGARGETVNVGGVHHKGRTAIEGGSDALGGDVEGEGGCVYVCVCVCVCG
jgi:hypothetical protein